MKKEKHRVYVRRGFQPKKKWAVFLDRDGTINLEKHLVYKLKYFELVAGAAEVIKKLNKQNIPVVVYHNASVVARGLCDEFQVMKLHNKMRRLLVKSNAYVDVILFCPHHPKAFNLRYAFDCDWRKPKSGMMRFAREKFEFDLGKSFVVGDSARDILMGQAEEAYSILVQSGHAGKDTLYKAKPDKTVKDISAAVEFILGEIKK